VQGLRRMRTLLLFVAVLYRLLVGDSMQSMKHLVGRHRLRNHKPWESYDPRKISPEEIRAAFDEEIERQS
jgi:hypothetical protein